MAFMVETGNGDALANSLVSVEWADAHLAATGYAVTWDNLTVDRKQELLVTATGIIGSSFSWRGYILKETQNLYFPRRDLRDREGRLVVGVPALVRNAISELADFISVNNPYADSDLAALESIKVGPISLEVSESASTTKVLPDSIIRMLAEFGVYRFSKNRMRRLVAG